MSITKFMSNKKIQKFIAVILLIASMAGLILSFVSYSFGDNYSMIGTNLALGSPILNKDATSEDWNTYETAVWGIFLSNFCTPFVDNYESAFNKGSQSGSKGSGCKALEFGTGSDIENSKVIQNLTTYAINNQANNVRKISVSYNGIHDLDYKYCNIFTSGADQSAASPSPSASAQPSDSASPATTTTTDTPLSKTKEASKNCAIDKSDDWTVAAAAPTSRDATLRDLIIQTSQPSDNIFDTTWADLNADQTKIDIVLPLANYPNLKGTYNTNLPTFAVKGANKSWQVVLDYRDTFDLEMFTGAVCYALSSDYADNAAENINNIGLDSPLYLDGYGNICVSLSGRYIIIIPASANQHLTKTDSLNFINSLMFNCSNSATNPSNLSLCGGCIEMDDDIPKYRTSGSLAFNRGNKGTKSGGMALFYDTDTVVIDGVGNNSSGIMIDGLHQNNVNVHAGNILKGLFNLDITDSSNQTKFKVEPVNASSYLFDKISNGESKDKNQSSGEDLRSMFSGSVAASGYISNLTESDGSKKRLTEICDCTSSNSIKPFENSMTVSLSSGDGIAKSGSYNQWAVYRSLESMMYNVFNNPNDKTHKYQVDKEFVESALSSSADPYTLMSNVVFSGGASGKDNRLSNFAKEFMSKYTNLYKIKDYNKLDAIKAGTAFNVSGPSDAIALVDVNGNKNDEAVEKKFTKTNSFMKLDVLDNQEVADYTFGRTAKVYYSDTMKDICDVLGMRNGTDFSVFSANIYLTYLNWYGLAKDSLSGDYTSNLNENLFSKDAMIKNISDVAPVKSKEDKANEVLEYTYLMLHPTDGKSYRTEMALSNMANWVYKQYQKIVYGNESSYNSKVSTNESGFLSIENYSENFMTKWFMTKYSTLAIYLIGFGVILIVVIGALKKRRSSWYLLATVLVITVVLVLPSTGEIVPYVANNVVQKVFEDKMTYWSISEQITNATMQKDYYDETYMKSLYGNTLTKEEMSQALGIIQSVKSDYLDKYISVKQDISNKVTNSSSDQFEKVQEMKSTRWLLPTIMREATSSDHPEDYVYVTLSDKTEDTSNMYWFYKPMDAKFSKTRNSCCEKPATYTSGGTATDESKLVGIQESAGRQNVYTKYKELTSDSSEPVHYRSIAYERNSSNLAHTYFYLLDYSGFVNTDMISVNAKDYKSYDDWLKAYCNRLKTSVSDNTYKQAAQDMETNAGLYQRTDRSTVKQSYGFLWNTESPLHYFFEVVKDSFNSNSSVGSLLNDLEGSYKKLDNSSSNSNGTEYRKCMMNSDKNGKCRDVLDLENMFNNVLPYMYTVQLTAGGEDGDSGIFGSERMSSYPAYEKMNTSWLFRSNWVTKIMENSQYNKADKIYYYSGGKRVQATVANMLVPEYYEAAGRPMVFSEAQEVDLGLTDEDLSIVELKCVNLNKDISKQWTLLINYVSTPGITRDVIQNQMAIDATLEFNKAFTPYGIASSSKAMYPTSLNLRSISFDSVMCMLMLNITKDTSYVYNNSMEVFIGNSDMFTAFILLIAAILCALLIPFVRCVTLGLLFYLGYFSVMATLFKGSRDKLNTSFGFLGCHAIYLAVNVLYLLGFKLLMSVTSTDEVLSVSSVKDMNVGNPLWCLIVIIALSIAYIVISFKMINFCIRNFRDMGYAVMKETVETVTENVSAGFEKLQNNLENMASEDSSGSNSTGTGAGSSTQDPKKGSSKGKSRSSKGSSGGSSESGDSGSTNNKSQDDRSSDSSNEKDYSYKNSDTDKTDKHEEEKDNTNSINDRINKGRSEVKDDVADKSKDDHQNKKSEKATSNDNKYQYTSSSASRAKSDESSNSSKFNVKHPNSSSKAAGTDSKS